ncbi:hypothetical protein Tco_0327226 [Tanacetum coccineum]
MVASKLSQMPPTSKSSTPPTIEESLAKLGDLIDKLELVTKHLVAKRLNASTANLVSVTTKATTVVSTITITKSSDHTTNNIHHPTTNNHDMTIPNTDTKVVTQTSLSPTELTPSPFKSPTHNITQIQPNNYVNLRATAPHIVGTKHPSTDFPSIQNQTFGLLLQHLATTESNKPNAPEELCFVWPKNFPPVTMSSTKVCIS